ncbi:hypothetical protein [Microvirga arsenatis]|uniref:Holin n=1 Tax=Microvirga arsenatis TaxID=2692265 RepID=A0ABW9Z1L1_9HYPH|nr:hypothetical protein [Microvirga arsenatis]NBJ13189.1 hypothetical protein [Microvirga arsenatis]NBJ25173.1 hypothetical protein [Microvirga arsenatis]
MKLIDNVKTVLTKGLSAQVVYLGALAEIVLEYVLQVGGLPPWAVLVLLGAILVARVIKQDSVSGGASEQTESDPWAV